jgi:GNAT superfamily N-acetyltransferase
MTITADIVEAFLKCPTKCYLRFRGEVGTGNAYAEWVRTQNESCRREGIKRLMAETAPGECVGSPSVAANLKTAKWRLATEYVARSQNMESGLHAVEHIPSEGRGKPAQFIPIRFVFTNKLNRDDKLLLADLIVDPVHRGRGVGRLLLNAVLAYLKARGAPRVVLSTAEGNQAAQRLFASMGFRRTTMVEMTRELEETTRGCEGRSGGAEG